MNTQAHHDEVVIMENLEEGEVTSVSDSEYTPLERPANYSNIKHDSRFPEPSSQYSESEESSTDYDSDSDSTGVHKQKPKKPKIKLQPKVTTFNKKQKYDIWSKKVQEDVLSETLNCCDVTKKDRSRDVESYDFSGCEYVIEAFKYKRTRQDRKDVHRRLGKRVNTEQKDVKGKSRNIVDLVTTVDNSAEEIAKDIANKLYEQKEELISKAINTIGKQKCIDIFQETRKIEANGGMLIMNLTRRRTPGGVFFYLLKVDEGITRKQKDEIFNEDRKQILKERKMKRVDKIKKERDSERAKLLPELLSKAQKLFENRPLKEANEADVVNPPPTPETDGHETSYDGTESSINTGKKSGSLKTRDKLTTYDDQFLDISLSHNEMDLF